MADHCVNNLVLRLSKVCHKLLDGDRPTRAFPRTREHRMRRNKRKAPNIVHNGDQTEHLVDALKAARQRFNTTPALESTAGVALVAAERSLFASTPTTPAGLLAFVQCVRQDYDAPDVFDVIERALRGMAA